MPKCPSCGTENLEEHKFCYKCGAGFGGATGKLYADTVLDNRYVVVKTIGRGGMGAVYLALDQRLNNKTVAIKEMSSNAVGTGHLMSAVDAFRSEATMLISLRHKALPVITDFFAGEDQRWYLVMDYIKGDSLKQVAEDRGPIPEAEVLDWARQLCEIIDYLHTRQPPVIFRDLKPSNIMLTPEGSIKLIDFGIARHFRPENSNDTYVYGSAGFSPPEQYGKNQTDARSDIFSLGVTLHYLLTGIDPEKNPFTFDPPSNTVSVSLQFEEAIMKCLELRPENRPQNIGEVLALLPGGQQEDTPAAAMDVRTGGLGLQAVGQTLPEPDSVPLPDSVEPASKSGITDSLLKAVSVSKTGTELNKFWTSRSKKRVIAGLVCLLVLFIGWKVFAKPSVPPESKETVTPANQETDLSAPVIKSPDDGSALDLSDVTVRWDPVSKAKEYQVSVKNLSKNKFIVSGFITSDSAFVIEKSKFIPGDQYIAWVTARDDAGIESGAKVGFTISKPGVIVITSPMNGSEVEQDDLRVKWKYEGILASYSYKVSDITSGYELMPAAKTGGTEFIINKSRLTPGHNYQVVVSGIDQKGKNIVSNVKFSVKKPVVVTAPVITSPYSGAKLDKTNIRVSWRRVTGAQKYIVRLYKQSNAVVTSTTSASATSYTINASKINPNTWYTVTVSSKDAGGREYTSKSNFFIKPLDSGRLPGKLTAPVINSFKNYANLKLGNVVVSWRPVPGAIRYKYRVYDGSWPITSVGIIGRTSFTINSSILTPGHTYRVWVAAEDNSMQKSTYAYFRVDG